MDPPTLETPPFEIFIKSVVSNPESSKPPPPRNLSDFPNLHGIDDPEKRRKVIASYIKRQKALMEPKWSPCPPTASESVLQEIPVYGKAVRAPNDLERKYIEAYRGSMGRTTIVDDLVNKLERTRTRDDLIDKLDLISRDRRRCNAEDFRSSYVYRRNSSMDMKDQKTCIWSSGTYTWPAEKSSGITWLALHGMNSICVVTRNVAEGVTRLGDYLKVCKHHVRGLFRETIISEMEDLADPSSEARQNIHQSFDKPFAVVSLIPAGTNKANEESGTEARGAVYDEKRAINFLRERMESGSTYTYGYSETLQTAVSAFLLLFDMELKAKDIKVCVLTNGYSAKHLRIRDAGENLVFMYSEGIETLVERLPK